MSISMIISHKRSSTSLRDAPLDINQSNTSDADRLDNEREERDRERGRQAERERGRERGRGKQRGSGREAERQKVIERERERERQRGRESGEKRDWAVKRVRSAHYTIRSMQSTSHRPDALLAVHQDTPLRCHGSLHKRDERRKELRNVLGRVVVKRTLHVLWGQGSKFR
jgi:hypothetical protein